LFMSITSAGNDRAPDRGYKIFCRAARLQCRFGSRDLT
jgi:hypothetical protein